MSELIVNLDWSAAMRSRHGLSDPDPAQLAVVCELAGADGIMVQIRRTQRILTDRDLYMLKGIVHTSLTVQMPVAEESIEKILKLKPHRVILAADHADAGQPLSPIDFSIGSIDFSEFVNPLKAVDIEVGFLIMPAVEQAKGAAKAGASMVMIDVSDFTRAKNVADAQIALDRIDESTHLALRSKLTVLAGRGISYRNIKPLCELGRIGEFAVGNAIGTRATMVGIDAAVREMKSLMDMPATSG